MSHKKEYVQVTLSVDESGKVSPISITFQKTKQYVIDSFTDICQAAATKVNGCGVRYTVIIQGKETYLFEECGRWFVEALASA